MTEVPRQRAVPRPGLLRWEIGFALIIKVILLAGLWILIFRWPDKSVARPDIAERFALSSTVTNATKYPLSTQPSK